MMRCTYHTVPPYVSSLEEQVIRDLSWESETKATGLPEGRET